MFFSEMPTQDRPSHLEKGPMNVQRFPLSTVEMLGYFAGANTQAVELMWAMRTETNLFLQRFHNLLGFLRGLLVLQKGLDKLVNSFHKICK